MKFIFGIIGAYLGALLGSISGFCFGAAIGVLFGFVIDQGKKIRALEERIKSIQTNLVDSNVMVDETSTEGIQVDKIDIEEIAITDEVVDSESITQINPVTKEIETVEQPVSTSHSGWDTVESDATEAVYLIDKLVGRIKHFFSTGNVVVKVGVIILFFGVAFLLKYAAQHNAFPIEFRLMAVAAGGIVMLVFGWRLRHTKTKYALVLQGGAVGILYLTVFSSAKLYSVLPLQLTFLLMFGLVVFSSILAVLQNSRSLACLATIGGFLAPVLTSSGGGSHVALFSYYAILNAGIFAIAWFKAWRILNWLGFVFTFVIASLWGYDSYRPEFFNTTEPFLILFFVFYVLIPILFAHRQPPHLKGLVDGSLVFGVPLVGFTLQSLLVKDYEFGQAMSALGLSVIYVLLARWLWTKKNEGMRLLTESFIALAVIFGSLAIPFALDGNWTAAAWSLEGAGIAWVGIKQRHLLPRLFGVLLQIGGGIIFIIDNQPAYSSIPIVNSAYMGAVLVSIGGLFSSYQFYKHPFQLKQAERPLHWLLLVWALIWWFYCGLNEIDIYVVSRYELNAALFFTTISTYVLLLIARLFVWKTAEYPSILFLPAIYMFALIQFIDAPSKSPFRNYGYISWITSFLVQIIILYRCDHSWNKKLLSVWHSFSMYFYILFGCWLISEWVDNYFPGRWTIWEAVIWGLIPAIAILKITLLRNRMLWPIKKYPESYLGLGLLPVVICLCFWIIMACQLIGNPGPLPYIPIINPLELTQLFSIIVVINWLMLIRQGMIEKTGFVNTTLALNFMAFMIFIFITSVVAHSVHFYAGVRFDEYAMLRSEVFQASISIIWTLLAFGIMWMATQKQIRKLWFVGTGLLAIVVIKLFLIDLADSGAVARIVSFITVGLLMLLIGYLSPIPPKENIENTV